MKIFAYEHGGSCESFCDLIPLDSVFSLNAEECAKRTASWLHVGINDYVHSRKVSGETIL